MLQLQEQHGDLLGPLHPGRGAGKAGAGTPATDERFAKLSGGYEAEQKDLQEKVAILQAELTGQEEQAMNLDRFLAIVKKYTEIEKLTPTILNEFVEKIIVHAPDKSTGKRVQQVEISYNCVGMIELPDTNETNSKTA